MRTQTGKLGEKYVCQLFTNMGWESVLGGVNDLTTIINGRSVNIEVKTANKNKDNTWRFTLYKKDHTDHKTSDYVILVALTGYSPVLFVIPTDHIKDRNTVAISSNPRTYTGKFAQYRI
jgi:hypothetical protein